jgi:hypothetical protein
MRWHELGWWCYFYLFHVVLIYPFANLWSFWKWGHNEGDDATLSINTLLLSKLLQSLKLALHFLTARTSFLNNNFLEC